jgi:hypothetical protein
MLGSRKLVACSLGFRMPVLMAVWLRIFVMMLSMLLWK